MQQRRLFFIQLLGLLALVSLSSSVAATVILGKGNSSLLGGDLSDPEDTVVDVGSYGMVKTADEMKPPKAPWRAVVLSPTSPPGTAPHQIHAYQSWQDSPACAIFLNKPETRKWYISFIDGGYGGPTEAEPYACAVQFYQPHVLTHFTLTSAPEMPDRDPKQWAIQGSNTGDDDDWVDIYRCDAADRSSSPFQVKGRTQTILFTSFTSASIAKELGASELKKLMAGLKGTKITTADFVNNHKAYAWFRIVVYSCFNPNSTTFANFNRPPGFSLGQLELFGVPGDAEPIVVQPRVRRVKIPVEELIVPEAYDPAFIISYWCGPPKAETTLERYREIKDCGFNVAFPAIDQLWEAGSKENTEHNQKYLDICQQAGLKALVWDGAIPKGNGWSQPTAAEVPGIEKSLDDLIAKYASHPALCGYVLGDEMGMSQHARLGVVTAYLLKKDPRHLPYYNLLPNYAFKQNSEYEALVSDYIDTVKPVLVSWDHYRQMFEGGDERFYWHNLEIMRRLSIKKRIPYNQIIVSLKHMGYRECSEVDLRWQVYTSLAYGSRGIQYFTYWYVKELAWAEAPAMITKDGKRDLKWEYAKKINNRIAKLGPTLATLTSTGVYCTTPLPPGAQKLRAEAPVTKAEGGPLAIGCFQDPAGKQYILVVNRSFKTAVNASLKLHSRVTSAAEISQETGKTLDPQPTQNAPLGIALEAGEGRLFVLSETGIFFQPLAEILGGEDSELTAIEFEPVNADSKSTGTLFWRRSGDASFTGLPLQPIDATHLKVTLPAAITQAPFDYYLEIQEPDSQPIREPRLGAEAPLVAVPDQSPPTAVQELATAVAKSYRVALTWKPATDDRGVAGYCVYRGTEDAFPIGDKPALARLPANKQNFTDDSPPSKQTAWYAVQAVDVVGRKGKVEYIRVNVPDHEPPANTLSLKAQPGSKSVMLTWSGDLEPIVSALEIHRGEGAQGALTKLDEVTDMAASLYLDATAAYGTQYRYEIRPRSREGLLGESGQSASASPLRYIKRINCGGPEIAAEDGVAWEADRNPEHADLTSSGTAVFTVPNPISGSGELKEICQTERWANRQVSYRFEVEPGRYEVVLVFAETNPSFFSKNKRPFDIVINEEKLAEKIDVFSEAGGSMTPWKFRKVIDVAQRELTVSLLANRAGPAIKGIEVRSVAE